VRSVLYKIESRYWKRNHRDCHLELEEVIKQALYTTTIEEVDQYAKAVSLQMTPVSLFWELTFTRVDKLLSSEEELL
jgi:hypothetical protein